MDSEDIILRIKTENTEALQALTQQRQAVDNLRASNKSLEAENKTLQKSMDELSKAGKANTEEYKAQQKQVQENRATITANNEAIKAANKEMTEQSRTIQNNIKVQRENTDSIKAMRAQLSSMKDQYYSMSKAQRESADGGVALQRQIKALNDDISKAEQSVGVFSRNVGNYENAINSALGANKGWLGQLSAMQKQAAATGQSFGTVLANGVKAVGKAFAALLANPIVLTLAAIVAVITALTKAIKGNEEQSRQLQVIMAPLNRAFEAFKAVLQQVADGLIAVMGWVSKLAGGVSKLMERLPFVGKYIAQANEATERAIQLERDKQALEDAERGMQLESARTAERVSELRAKVAERDKYSAQERIDMLNEAADAEKALAEKEIANAEERLRLAKQEASYSKNSKEANEELVRLEADVINKRTQLNEKLRGLEKGRQTAIKEIAAEQKAADEDRLKREKEYQDLVTSGQKKIRDLTLQLMADGADKEKAIRAQKYKEELEAVKGTEKQKAEIRALLAEQYARDIAAIEAKYSEEELNRQVERRTEELNIMLELAKGDIDRRLEIQSEQLELERQQAVAAAERKGIDIELVEQQYAQRKRELEQQAEEDRRTEQAKRLQEYMQERAERDAAELEALGENELAKSEVRLRQAQEEEAALLAMDEETKAQLFASNEEYTKAVQDAAKKRKQAETEAEDEAKKARIAAIKAAQAQLDAVGDIAGGLTDLFNQIGGDNEKMQGFLKATALFQIGVDMAKAIAGAISGAMTMPFPANIAAVVTGIASVTAGIIQAKQVLSKQQEVDAPKFAKGGLVSGEGTGTSDSIPARLSDGEYVINARSTAMYLPLLNSINQAGGGVPINMEATATQAMGDDFLSESIANAMMMMPNPIVSVQEIAEVNARVQVNETLRNR